MFMDWLDFGTGRSKVQDAIGVNMGKDLGPSLCILQELFETVKNTEAMSHTSENMGLKGERSRSKYIAKYPISIS